MMKRRFVAALGPGLVAVSGLFAVAYASAESLCHGSVAQGSIERSVSLPVSGANFVAYSQSPVVAGRQYLHSRVATTLLTAYAALAGVDPALRFMTGETGLQNGGPIKPHKTHQNGLSVDLFVPVRDGSGRSATMPTSERNRFGYAIEFNAQSRFGAYEIDYPALGELLYQISIAGNANGAPINMVIFDQAYLPALLRTPRGPFLRTHVHFMAAKPWVRHDEHVHVDFDVPCAP